MNTDKHEPKRPALAERRAALIAKCELQRTELGREMSFIRAPHSLTGGSFLHTFTGGKFKVPLAILGTVLGIVAAKPGRHDAAGESGIVGVQDGQVGGVDAAGKSRPSSSRYCSASARQLVAQLAPARRRGLHGRHDLVLHAGLLHAGQWPRRWCLPWT